MNPQALQDLHDRLLALHEEGRSLGQHQAAYHALAGALHAAESLRDLQAIDRVEERARDHAAWLDRHAPNHPLSSRSAATRGHHGIFEQLAVTAAAARARIKSEKLTRK